MRLVSGYKMFSMIAVVVRQRVLCSHFYLILAY